MKFSTVVLAAAIGVSAHPSGHAHRNAHRSLEAREGKFVMAKKPAPPPPPPPKTTAAPPPKSTTPPPPPPPPPKTRTPAAPKANAAASSGGSGHDSYQPFCGGEKRSIKRATLGQIAYQGNIGTPDKFGCNWMLIQKSVADKYDYTIEINNDGGDSTCKCWNKIGRDHKVNGFFTGNEVLTFTLQAGATQYVAADKNTQGACACHEGSTFPLTTFGEFASTWLEVDFGNESNQGWAGGDVSCLVAAKYGLNIPGATLCHGSTCSVVNPGGTGHNAFLGGMEALDGLGLNIPAGNAHLVAHVNYSG